ncbi:MAG: hypothetical protein J6U96_00070, partial [Elusimicrobiaceae bacterium]|nr:hypothetical protein [Elusimicrobiaceae bacterium]
MENNQMDSQLDISQFLNKFNQGTTPSSSDILSSEKPSISLSSVEENSRSFEKLEQKMEALEEKFAISSAQNDAVLKELAYTRQAVESQKTRDAFLSNLSTTIANLKASVEALSRNRPYTPVYNPPPPPRSFDTPATASYTTQTYYTQPATGQQNELRLAYQEKEAALAALHTARLEKEQVEASWNADRTAQESTIQQLRAEKDLAQAGWEAALSEKDKLAASWDKERAAQLIELDVAKTETTEKNRIIASLQQKASQLKAVNVALDREIKRVQQERTEALRKSAEQ